MKRCPFVRVLLDEQLPRQLGAHFVGHVVSTVQQEGWAGLKNGELLTRAEAAGFEAFVTADQNLQFQQNLTKSRLLIIVIVAASNALEDLVPGIPEMLSALASSKRGQFVRVTV